MATSKKRSRRPAVSGRRAARAQQIWRDLSRFEAAFDDWAYSDAGADAVAFDDSVEPIAATLLLMPGVPRSVTSWSAHDLIAALEQLDHQDRSGETTTLVRHRLGAWAKFLDATGRWSAGDRELGETFAVLSVGDEPERLLDEPERHDLWEMSRWGATEAELAALDATTTVRQCASLLEWFARESRAARTATMTMPGYVAVAEHLGLVGDDAVQRALRLVGALSDADLLRVSDGRMGPSETAYRWTSDDLETAVTVRRDVVAALVAWHLLPIRVSQEEPMRVAAEALQLVLSTGRVGTAELAVLTAATLPGGDDLVREVQDLLGLVAADGFIEVDADGYRLVDHLAPTLAAALFDVDSELRNTL